MTRFTQVLKTTGSVESWIEEFQQFIDEAVSETLSIQPPSWEWREVQYSDQIRIPVKPEDNSQPATELTLCEKNRFKGKTRGGFLVRAFIQCIGDENWVETSYEILTEIDLGRMPALRRLWIYITRPDGSKTSKRFEY